MSDEKAPDSKSNLSSASKTSDSPNSSDPSGPRNLSDSSGLRNLSLLDATPADLELVSAVAEALRRRGAQTLSFAESCTGGLLSALFASVAGVSDVYLGSIVSYSNQMKEEILRVPISLLRTMGAVSPPVAREMAVGVARSRRELRGR